MLTLIQTGLLNGKSIGFLPTVLHAPTADEVKRRLREWLKSEGDK